MLLALCAAGLATVSLALLKSSKREKEARDRYEMLAYLHRRDHEKP
jgi:hypothetical protein